MKNYDGKVNVVVAKGKQTKIYLGGGDTGERSVVNNTREEGGGDQSQAVDERVDVVQSVTFAAFVSLTFSTWR